MDNKNIAERLITTKFDIEMMNKWDNVAPILARDYVEKIINIPPVLQVKYKFDLYGLLLELDIPHTHIYPHIIVNGYTSSNEYDGEGTLKILDKNRVAMYDNMFRKKKVKK